MTTRPTVLLTCVGGALSTAVIRSLREQNELPLRLVGVDGDARAAGRQAVDVFETVPWGSDPAYAPRLLELCAREGVQVVLPGSDEEAAALAEAGEAFQRAGVTCAVPRRETVQLLRHKGRLMAALQEAGIAVAAFRQAAAPSELKTAAEALGYPERTLVVKPCTARGGRGAVILQERAGSAQELFADRGQMRLRLDELLSRWTPQVAGPELLVMDYLPGAAYDIDVLSRAGEAECLAVRRRYNPLGIPFAGCITEADERIERKARAVSAALRLEFCCDIDLALSAGGEPHVLEVNPRLSGSVIGSVAAGINFPLEAVRMALGLPPAPRVARPGVETLPVTEVRATAYRLRPAAVADARLLWAWVNDPAARRQAFQDAQIPWDAHKTWFDRKLADQATCLLAILESTDGAPAGQIRFDQVADGLEIDLSVGKEHRGRRLGHELLRQGLQQARTRWPSGTRVVAHVLEGNGASSRVFARGGFVSTGRRQVQGKGCERWERSL